MQFVFDTLRESLFVLNQVLSLFISDDNRTHMSARSVPSIKQLVSSANKIDVRRVDTLHKCNVCMSSFSRDLTFEVCKFPIARHTHPCVAIQWNLVGKVPGHWIDTWLRIGTGSWIDAGNRVRLGLGLEFGLCTANVIWVVYIELTLPKPELWPLIIIYKIRYLTIVLNNFRTPKQKTREDRNRFDTVRRNPECLSRS